MKRVILSLSFLLTIGATVAFAGENPGTDPQVIKSFQKEFNGAEDVKWSNDAGFVKATFILANHRTLAWFSQDGELVGSIRDLFYNQLPLVVIKSLDKRFPQAVMIDIREVVTAEGTRYKFTLEQKDRKYKVSVYADGNVEQAERVKK
jgi:hypothetical protein